MFKKGRVQSKIYIGSILEKDIKELDPRDAYKYLGRIYNIVQSNTAIVNILFIGLGRHFSIPLESSSGPSIKNVWILYMELVKCVMGSQTLTYNLRLQYMSLFSYCSIWIFVLEL